MHLLAVFAHPDDETYSVGGCVARCIDEGIGATIITFTRGEAGQITEGSGATRETLGDVRERELREACRILGCTDVRVVGTGDGATTVTQEGIDYIVSVIQELRPEVVVTMEPEGVTSHPDHKAVSKMTVQAVERVGDDGIVKRLFFSAIPKALFDEWMRMSEAAGVQAFAPDDPLAPRPAPDESIAVIVDLADDVKRKIEALWAHKTQSQEFIASQPAEVAQTVLRIEAFQRAIPQRSAGDPVTNDLFEGLR